MTFDEWWDDWIVGHKEAIYDVAFCRCVWNAGYREAYREILAGQMDAKPEIEKGEMARVKNFKSLL